MGIKEPPFSRVKLAVLIIVAAALGWFLVAGCSTQKAVAPKHEALAVAPAIWNHPIFNPDGSGGWNIVPPTNCFLQLETSMDLRHWTLMPPQYYGFDPNATTNYIVFRATNAMQFWRLVCSTNMITNS